MGGGGGPEGGGRGLWGWGGRLNLPPPPNTFCSGLIAEQPDAGLFFVDTGNAEKGERCGGSLGFPPLPPPDPSPAFDWGGSIEIYLLPPLPPPGRKRKNKIREKPLHIDLVLQPDSKVPPPKE